MQLACHKKNVPAKKPTEMKCSPRFGNNEDKPLTLNELSSDMDDLSDQNSIDLSSKKPLDIGEQQFIIMGTKGREKETKKVGGKVNLLDTENSENYNTELDLLRSQSNHKIFKVENTHIIYIYI